MYIEESFDVMYRVYDLIVYMIENCVLCILYLDMIINKKNYFIFICLFVYLVVFLICG